MAERPDPMTALAWRCIGPHRGGRVMAVLGDPSDLRAAYAGASGGGVWKTTDGGASWRNISDPYFKRGSVGALAMAESDPSVLYAGMGECGFRANVTHGDGVYTSEDGGRRWTHLGLAETHNIGRIRVHPRDPRVVYVAALGHRFGPNPERGVYRSTDGGRRWDHVLALGPRAGAVDLAMDPRDPRILYAAVWEAERRPWGFSSGGPLSGLYKTGDGGETWRSLNDRPGWPRGVVGRTAVCVSPANPDRLYALVEAAPGGGLYRSSDGGESWTWTTDDANFRVRAWYLTHIVADPRDPDAVWLPNRKLWTSADAGRTFRLLNSSYWDQHDLWVDPRDRRHLVLGNDGGAAISYDGGLTWSTLFNQPTAEMYHVAADTRFPYRVYGAQQDNSTISIPSRSDRGPISQMDWYDVGGGESGYIAVRPDNADIVYASDLAGGVTRYDHANGQIRDISPWPVSLAGGPATSLRYRFNWSLPLLVSPHDPTVLYAAGNVLFRTADEGASWEVVSPDLTRNDTATLAASGGLSGAGEAQANEEDDYYCTIASLAESPLRPDVLWTGSDDGLVHLSADGGATWRNVTPGGLPEWASCAVEASPHDAAAAYLAATRHKLDDFRPYIYKTDDGGARWRPITRGIPHDQFVRVVRADPNRAGLLYAGTEAGVYYSLDDGDSWRPLQGNLPACAIYDLQVKDGDLLAATHGRGLWVLDDLTPLYAPDDETLATSPRLFTPRPAYRVIRQITGRESYIAYGYPAAAANPPAGAIISYYLAERPAGALTLTLLDGDGREVASYSSAIEAPEPHPLGPPSYRLRGGAAALVTSGSDDPAAGVRVGALSLPPSRIPSERLPSEPGLNRFAVALEYPGARTLPGYYPRGSTAVPLPPGRYEVRLALDGRVSTASLVVLPDPRIATPRRDMEAQAALLLDIRARVQALHDAVARLRPVRARVDAWLAGIGASGRPVTGAPADSVYAAASALSARLGEVEAAVIQVGLTDRSGELAAPRALPGISAKLETLASVVAGCDAAPTAQARALHAELAATARAQLAAAEALLSHDLPALDDAIRAAGLPLFALAP